MITVIGGGFAGVEAAWAAANRGEKVQLFEMRPVQQTGAHVTSYLAELVCSNSFKSKNPASPAGQLKAEMLALGSLILPIAAEHSVPGGEALAVDRDHFAAAVTATIEGHPNIEVKREVVTPTMIEEALLSGPVILATGPLTTKEVGDWLVGVTQQKQLYFYDAVSPVVTAESLDMDIIFAQSRYDKGEGDDYLNCPFNKEEYEHFVAELVAAERAPIHGFEANSEAEFVEKIQYFAGCMPIEIIAERGARSLAFGNYKPVGLTDPRTDRRPYAALQLRPENREKTLYSLVATQTRLKWGEQKRIFSLVPGLANAEFVRLGVIHRNTYVNAPQVLHPHLEAKDKPGLFIAGQLTGVEGYVESAAMGILAGIYASLYLQTKSYPKPARESAYGSLMNHLQDSTPRDFAPMNINWGLLPTPEAFLDKKKVDKGLVRIAKISAAQEASAAFAESLGLHHTAPVG